MKTRREFIQGLIVSVGGMAALSACDGERGYQRDKRQRSDAFL
jgi:hypothetical protein